MSCHVSPDNVVCQCRNEMVQPGTHVERGIAAYEAYYQFGNRYIKGEYYAARYIT